MKTRNTDIEILASRMRSVDFGPRRCRQALHAVIAGAQKHGTEDVDNDMYTGIHSSRHVALRFIKGSSSVVRSPGRDSPSKKGRVDHEYYRGKHY